MPFIIRWPAVIHKGVSNAMISQVDLLRSFAAFTHQSLSSEDAPDSYNVLNALLGKSNTGRESLVEEGGALALVKDDWKYIAPHKGPKVFKLVNIASGYDEEPQLYNLKKDISETNNLASKYPELVKQLSEELEKIKSKGYRE
jgi:arylsulfatase A-like enzyme